MLRAGSLAMLRLPAWVEAPVYGWERLVLLKHLLDAGLKKTDIAARLGVSRGLIYHWLRTGQLERELDAVPVPRTRVIAPAKLSPYEAIIDARLETHTITGAIVGVGSTQRASAVRWGVAGNIVWAWIFTIPASAFVAALGYWVSLFIF